MRLKLQHWPAELIFIRHADSGYTAFKRGLEVHPIYQEFLSEYEQWIISKRSASEILKKLAKSVMKDCILPYSDHETPLTDKGWREAMALGQAMPKEHEMPDVVYSSPHLRVRETVWGFGREYPRLLNLPNIFDQRLRGQEQGLVTLYNDWRLFTVFNRDQALLREKEGKFYYRYPNGENIPDIWLRIGQWCKHELPAFAGKRVWVFTHHKTILGFTAMMAKMGAPRYLELDQTSEPPTCSIARFEGRDVVEEDGGIGKFGELVCTDFNKCFGS